jgi:hypothetical protein
MFMVGATLGESIVPVLMGWAMRFGGPYAMVLMTFLSALALLVIYFIVHRISTCKTATEDRAGAVEWGNRSQHALLQSSDSINPVHDEATKDSQAVEKEEEYLKVEMAIIHHVQSC